MVKPKVSVIMPAYNALPYLQSAIEGILNQIFSNFELIIIDDCSKDATPSVLKKYAKNDKRIRIIRNSRNYGPAKCRNIGLRYARGEYIAVEDSDDISLPERLECQVNYLDEHPEVVLMGSFYHVIDENGQLIGTIKTPARDGELRKILLKANLMDHGSMMFRKDEIKKIGGYREQFTYAHDYDLVLRALEIGKVYNYPKVLHMWRYHRKSISSQKLAIQEYFAAMAKFLALERIKYGSEITKLEAPKTKIQCSSYALVRYRWANLTFLAGNTDEAKKKIKLLLGAELPFPLKVKLSLLYACMVGKKYSHELALRFLRFLWNYGVWL